MSATSANALKAYQQINVHSGVDAASPHRLVLMLMNGVLSATAAAKGHMERGEVEAKGIQIGKALDRIEGLRSSLDPGSGGEVAENLGRLYAYMTQQLLYANLQNDSALLDEVASLMNSLRAAWEAIDRDAPRRTPSEH